MNKDTMAKLIERGAVLERLKKGNLKQKDAGDELRLSERQIRRIYKRYLSEGVSGLIHKNIGKTSTRKFPEALEHQAIDWLRDHGPDFGSTFGREKLEEYLGIKVSVGTLRKWRMNHGLHVPRSRGLKKQFKRRERKSLFGSMVQIDGSPHNWFEGRRGKCALLTAIDDATGNIVARFAEEEETRDLMILMRTYIKKYGIPRMAYTDHGGPYKVNVGNADGTKKTQLERAFYQLGIELVHANSPQAKGRVERNHGTNQDRLIKEMRLRGISTIEDANNYLENEYLPDFNRRFVVKPAHNKDGHRPLNGLNLENFLCLEKKRVVQNDGIIQFEKRLFQITKNRIYAQPKSTVLVRQHLDGSISLWSKDIQLEYEELKSMPIKAMADSPKTCNNSFQPASQTARNWNNKFYTPYKLKYDYTNSTTQAPD
jgi:hypothetical protein